MLCNPDGGLALAVDPAATAQRLVTVSHSLSDPMQLWDAQIVFDRNTTEPLGLALINHCSGLALRGNLDNSPVSQIPVQDVDQFAFWEFVPSNGYAVIRLAERRTQNLTADPGATAGLPVMIADWRGGLPDYSQVWLIYESA